MSLTFVAAARKYFGFKEEGYKGKVGLSGFAEEIKELTPQDRAELAPLLTQELGEEVIP